jgi:hypothetical protein
MNQQVLRDSVLNMDNTTRTDSFHQQYYHTQQQAFMYQRPSSASFESIPRGAITNMPHMGYQQVVSNPNLAQNQPVSLGPTPQAPMFAVPAKGSRRPEKTSTNRVKGKCKIE